MTLVPFQCQERDEDCYKNDNSLTRVLKQNWEAWFFWTAYSTLECCKVNPMNVFLRIYQIVTYNTMCETIGGVPDRTTGRLSSANSRATKMLQL